MAPPPLSWPDPSAETLPQWRVWMTNLEIELLVLFDVPDHEASTYTGRALGVRFHQQPLKQVVAKKKVVRSSPKLRSLRSLASPLGQALAAFEDSALVNTALLNKAAAAFNNLSFAHLP